MNGGEATQRPEPQPEKCINCGEALTFEKCEWLPGVWEAWCSGCNDLGMGVGSDRTRAGAAEMWNEQFEYGGEDA